MRRIHGLTLVGLAAILISATMAVAAGSATATYEYVVPGSTVPGLSTGLVIDSASTVTITATGAICPYGGSFCPGPDGDTGWNTTGALYGGFPLPGAPAWGLLARIGGGSWIDVGSGPTPITGTGVLEFAVNDDFLSDNAGTFTVTVTVSSPKKTAATCKPGWGYGDKNHEHCGPPGQNKKPEGNEPKAPKGADGPSGDKGNSGNPGENGKGKGPSGK